MPPLRRRRRAPPRRSQQVCPAFPSADVRRAHPMTHRRRRGVASPTVNRRGRTDAVHPDLISDLIERRVSAITAPLETQQAARLRRPTRQAIEAMFTIEPPPAATIRGIACLQHRNVPPGVGREYVLPDLQRGLRHAGGRANARDVREHRRRPPLCLAAANMAATAPRRRRRLRPPRPNSRPLRGFISRRPVYVGGDDARASRASSSAVARPIQEPAPVTTATLPVMPAPV